MPSRGNTIFADRPVGAELASGASDAVLGLATVYRDASRATVHVAGDLDLSSMERLTATLEAHIDAGRRYLRVDLGSCTFLDSTALARLVPIHRRLLASRGTLILTGVGQRPARLLAITHLDSVLFVGGPRSV